MDFVWILLTKSNRFDHFLGENWQPKTVGSVTLWSPEAVSSVLQLLFVVIMINHYVGTMVWMWVEVLLCQTSSWNLMCSDFSFRRFWAIRAPFFVQHIFLKHLNWTKRVQSWMCSWKWWRPRAISGDLFQHLPSSPSRKIVVVLLCLVRRLWLVRCGTGGRLWEELGLWTLQRGRWIGGKIWRKPWFALKKGGVLLFSTNSRTFSCCLAKLVYNHYNN